MNAGQFSDVLERAKTDLRYLIESLFSIVDKDSREVPYIFNPVQSHHWDRIDRRNIICKSRKMGFTTEHIARKIAKCLVLPYRRCVLLSHEGEATKRLFARGQVMLDRLPFALHRGHESSSMWSFPHTKSTFYIGTAGQKAFARGDDVTDYHCSEFAFWENPGILTGIEEACVNDSEGTIESTANGWGTPYHEIWNRAVGGEVGSDVYERDLEVKESDVAKLSFYKPHFYGWNADPTYSVPWDKTRPIEDLDEYERKIQKEHGLTYGQLAWRRQKIASMHDPSKFPQEYPITPEEAFLTAGSLVFDSYALREMDRTKRPEMFRGELKDTGTTIKLEPRERGRLRVYIAPQKGHSYVIGADVAAGMDDGDYSVGSVYDSATREQVAQWHGHIDPHSFGDVLFMLGAFYNWAFLGPEVNNHGLATLYRLRELSYPNLYIRDNNTGGTDMGWYTSPGEGGTRTELITAYRRAISEYETKINSPISIHECLSFIYDEKGKMVPQPGAFKDTIFADGIAQVLLDKGYHMPETFDGGGKDKIGIARLKRPGVGRIVYPRKPGYR